MVETPNQSEYPAKKTLQIKSPDGGSLTVVHENNDLVADTIGHDQAAYVHAMLGSYDKAFVNPPPQLADYLFEQWSHVPWKGDMLVRIGHGSLRDSIRRLLARDDEIKGRPSRLLRFVLGIPTVFAAEMLGKLTRADHFNPMTNTVNIYHPEPAVGMHEMGHAIDFDTRRRKTAWVLNRIPILRTRKEWEASKQAMKRFKDDGERRWAMKLLEPALGSYAGADLAEISRRLIDRQSEQVRSYLPLMGVIAGHIAARMPGRKSSFGYKLTDEQNQDQTLPSQQSTKELLGIFRDMLLTTYDITSRAHYESFQKIKNALPQATLPRRVMDRLEPVAKIQAGVLGAKSQVDHWVWEIAKWSITHPQGSLLARNISGGFVTMPERLLTRVSSKLTERMIKKVFPSDQLRDNQIFEASAKP